MNQPSQDPHDLNRFITAQDGIYQQALAELIAGRKSSHWMWFVFPQIDGLGSSSTARHYAVKSMEEAALYLEHPVLGARLVQCSRAVLKLEGSSASEIFGYPDDLKFRSSITLFASVPAAGGVFRELLDKYFQGQPDQRTLQILAAMT